MTGLTDDFKIYFADRLLFSGLQGSYQRQEADNESGIDAVVILDTLAINDLKAYRKILSTMAENEKACGFISGKQALTNWPKHELFQLGRDTGPSYGGLDEIERQDVIAGVKIAASGLHHICSHMSVHASTPNYGKK